MALNLLDSLFRHATPDHGADKTIIGFPENGFTLFELAAATNDFSPTNKFGSGSSNIYRGVLSDGTPVAVKQFTTKSSIRGFTSEFNVCSRVNHKNIVQLIGCCTTPSRKLLVFEFVSDRSLDYYLSGNHQTVLGWSARVKVALGCAKALAYLHQDCNPKIIHCNVKPSNILLDAAFETKLADFSVAKIQGNESSHDTTNFVGSPGYIDPEYAVLGRISEKFDVYAFGVVVLELITGRKPSIRNEIFESLVVWATPLLEQAFNSNNYDALVDPRLSNKYDQNEMKRMVACAAAAVRPTGTSRPMLKMIVRALEGLLPLENL